MEKLKHIPLFQVEVGPRVH